MRKDKKITMQEMVEKMDAAKKVNPLDLSSDQDLSIALMNLISLEEHFFFSGAKTGKTGFYELINTVREMRKELMQRIVHKNTAEHGEVWCISKHLLAASMRLMEVGTKANAAGRADDAADLFAKAYDMYSLFWGINMDLIDLTGVQKIAPDVYERAMKDDEIKEVKSASHACELRATEAKGGKKSAKGVPADGQSTVRRLGNWVKNAVNCCIE